MEAAGGGVGNAEFNAYDPDFEGYDYAYAMLLGMVYAPATLMEAGAAVAGSIDLEPSEG